jgi:hypothetical protein
MYAGLLAQGAPALNCPGCGTQVADGTSICPQCDYIIDASFLSAEPPAGGDDDESTGASEDPRKAAPRARTGATGPRPAVKSTTGSTRRVSTGQTGSRSAVAPRAGGSKPAVRAVSKSARAVPARRAPEPPDDWPQDDAEPRRALLPPSSPAPHSTHSGIVAPEEVLSDARDFVSGLTRADKITFTGAVVIILSCFIPWKETAAEGEVLGLMSMGVGALLGAALIIGAIAVRVRRTMPDLNPLVPWVLQIGMAAFCIFYTVVAIQLSFNPNEVPAAEGNELVKSSSPSFGAFLALLGGLGALAGSLLGMKERV